MFLRESRQKLASGTVVSHYQLAESVWDKTTKRAKTRLIYSFGRAEDPKVTERLRKLAKSILRRCSPDEIVADDPSWKVVDAWPYGPVHVLEALWSRLGIPEVIGLQAQSRKLNFGTDQIGAYIFTG